MLTFGEIVSLDSKAQFRNDVQLDSYDEPEKNLALLHSYLFTSSAPNRHDGGMRTISSLALLDVIRDAFLGSQGEHRLVAVANYGHGKSHLALALANYFGRSTDSAEVQTVLGKIESSLANDPAKAARYRDFKSYRGEFLVVRLRGDNMRSLREQFITGLEQALDEHSATRNLRPKFWYATVEKVLTELDAAAIEKANAYLASHEMDVPLLLSRVRARADVYDLCIDLLRHLHGVRPNLGGEASLADLVRWAVDKTCAADGPLGGLLILFDEFSLYLDRYAHRSAAGELQDLLNGVETRKGKAVFLAFAQHDPITVALNIMSAGPARDSLIKELGRLPAKGKYALYSLMESVVDAYLMQSDDAWRRMRQEPHIQRSIDSANDLAYDRFFSRYKQDLKWPIEVFHETVTKGCFPLHPVTTALLCNMQFGVAPDGGAPRTVLGFIMEQIEGLRDEPIYYQGRMQWVLPIALVDYFSARLHGDAYSSYGKAMRSLPAEAPAEHEALLKALLLYELAGLKSRTEEIQVEFLAECAGVSATEAHNALKALANDRRIRKDPTYSTYSFWAASVNPDKLEKLVAEKINSLQFDNRALPVLQEALGSLGLSFGSVRQAVPWGEASDWAAAEFVLPASSLDSTVLRALGTRFEAHHSGIPEAPRGALVWIVVDDEDELQHTRRTLDSQLNKAFDEDAPVPVVCVVPNQPLPTLKKAFQRWQALAAFSNDDREQAGQDIYNAEVATVKAILRADLERLRGKESQWQIQARETSQYRVARPYRAALDAAGRPSVSAAVDACYHAAYRFAPPAFNTQYKLNTAKQRTAVRIIANALLSNSPAVIKNAIDGDSVAKEIRRRFLQGSWGLLSTDYRIKSPTDPRLQQAWQVLENAFPPGGAERMIKEPLLTLLNPPYGYDYNTATLLFCAWFGYHRHELALSVGGKLDTPDALTRMLTVGNKEFINALAVGSHVAIARRDPGELQREVDAIRQTIQRGESMNQEEAVKRIIVLKEFIADKGTSERQRSDTAGVLDTLERALKAARDYDTEATKIANALGTTDLRRLSTLLSSLKDMPQTELVQVETDNVEELRRKIVAQIGYAMEQDCIRFEDLQDITKTEHNLTQLRTRRDQMRRLGLEKLVERLEAAMQVVERKAQELQVINSEQATREKIAMMDAGSTLQQLTEWRERLKEISGYSASTMQLRDDRLAVLQRAIEELEFDAVSWQEQIDQATDRQRLSQISAKVLRQSARYANTTFYQLVDDALVRIQQVEAFLTAIAVYAQELARDIHQPSDAEALSAKLADLRVKSKEDVSKHHLAKLTELEEKLRRAVSTQEEQAVAWLRRRQEEFKAQQRDLVGLARQLRSVPPFLSPAALPAVDEMRSQVQAAIDGDIIKRIEQDFRSITDIEQRRACLERLQSLVEAPTVLA